MSSLQHAQSEDQDVKLPPTQDVILPDALGWESGPLSDQQLEQIAFLLFSFKYPAMSFDNALCAEERHECRQLALRLRVRFLKMDQWTVGDAAERLGAESQRLLFGERRLGATIRKEVNDYAASYVSDLWIAFRNRLFFAREVDANQHELEQEDAIGNR